MIRQPIVSVLGHVDHGKTTILDKIRGTAIASREAGAITQHIGATEVPLNTIMKICGNMIIGRKVKIPGLLFIDTPGHHSFITLRSRGGMLADLAVLVIDINEGLKPQTIESLSILRRFKTPFLIVANKIDLIPGWRKHIGLPFADSIEDQPESFVEELNRMLYDLVGKMYNQGFTSERYDKVGDFRRTVAIVPASAKYGEGIPDILLVLVGLSQRFLESTLKAEEGPAKGTVLEVKEEKGLGPTVDAIIYDGRIRKGDKVVLGTAGEPLVTRVRALLKPMPLDEIRDPQQRFDYVEEVSAAAGIKVSGSGLENAIAGGPLRVATDDVEKIKEEIRRESEIKIELKDQGIIVKADAIGSLEALAYELRQAEIPVRSASVGDVSRRDIVEAATTSDPLKRAILSFNVEVLPDAKEELQVSDVKLIEGEVVYKLLDDYEAWSTQKKLEMESERRAEVVHPGKVLLLPDCVFRVSKPAIVGVRVLAGRIRPGLSLLREDGRRLGKIKSIRSGDESLGECLAGDEVAIAVDSVTVGRQMDVGDVLYIDIPERDARILGDYDLNPDEKELLERIKRIKREQDPFWGM